MQEPLDESYFKWLYGQVADPDIHDRDLTFWRLLKILFVKEFRPLVPFDENRAADGKALRAEFLETQGVPDSEVDLSWMELECSVFELLVGLSRRMAFEVGGEPHYWFWHMMENLALADLNDRRRFTTNRVQRVLTRFVEREYEPDGRGGLFPLKNPTSDQRKEELWRQMGDYILEQGLIE